MSSYDQNPQIQSGTMAADPSTAAFSGAPPPGLSFPATPQEILQGIGSLPQDQWRQWSQALQQLPPNQPYNSMEDLQHAVQQGASHAGAPLTGASQGGTIQSG